MRFVRRFKVASRSDGTIIVRDARTNAPKLTVGSADEAMQLADALAEHACWLKKQTAPESAACPEVRGTTPTPAG